MGPVVHKNPAVTSEKKKNRKTFLKKH
jgi:hypothetical protein